MDIIQRLNELRLERNMSVYRLSELTGINQSTLANTFSRKIVPSIKNLTLLCEAMGITPAQFFTEQEAPELLTAEEERLLQDLRSLPEELKESIADLVRKVASLPR